jgi:hypothetical protein
MRRSFFLTLSLFTALAINSIFAQQIDTRNFIEVTGTSETEIVPDEIFVTIILKERFDGKDKITIEKQEGDLKAGLTELNIALSNLTLNDANADYRKVKAGKKDLIAMKSFLLKLTDVGTLDKVYKKLDAQNVEDAYISKLNHTKLQEFAKENRIKAIKAAKDKVDYLLAAVGQQAGKPLLINEVENSVFNNPYQHNAYYGGYYGGSRDRMSNVAQSLSSADASTEDPYEISFTKIKLKSSYFVKYEILAK